MTKAHTLNTLRQLLERITGGHGPTTGAVASNAGQTYVQAQTNLRQLKAEGLVHDYVGKGEVCSRWLLGPGDAGAQAANKATADDVNALTKGMIP